MIKMLDVSYIIVCIMLLKVVYTQRIVGDSCISKALGSPGVCKLLKNCQQVCDEVVKLHVLPQTCGFQGTQAIVCCPRGPRKPGEVSQQKCRQYSSYAHEKDLSTEAAQSTKNECGHKLVKRIVGGQVAARKEFAHMALVGFESEPGVVIWGNGGTIISEEYILTNAASLAFRYEGAAKYVAVGITNINDTNHRQELKVKYIIRHPQFKPPSVYHDIGLIKLEKPVTMNTFARPACLYVLSKISVENAIATGWGTTSLGGPKSDDLLKVTLDFVDHEFCNMSYKVGRKLQNGIVDEIQICAGTEEKDTCQGDSGGPLQIYHDADDVTCMYDIVGLISFGKACGSGTGIYTRVSHYIKWIEDIVWPESP